MKINSLKHRLINSILRSPSNHKIFFMHLPKTGGTSVDEAIHDKFKTLTYNERVEYARFDSIAAASMAALLYEYDFESGNADDYQMQRFGIEYLAYLMNKPKVKYISGHLCFDERIHHRYHSDFKFITVLRDPVKRFLSMFFYIKHRTTRNEDRNRLNINNSLEDYIKTEHAKQLGHEYVKHYAGISTDRAFYSSEAAVEKAIENLGKFDVVGTLENIGVFQDKIKSDLGLSIVVGSKNASPASVKQREVEINDDIIQEINNICAQDYKIYNHVVNIVRKLA